MTNFEVGGRVVVANHQGVLYRSYAIFDKFDNESDDFYLRAIQRPPGSDSLVVRAPVGAFGTIIDNERRRNCILVDWDRHYVPGHKSLYIDCDAIRTPNILEQLADVSDDE